MVHINKIKELILVTSILLITGIIVQSQTVTDIDGNEYTYVTIGSQTWLQQDMRVLHYPDGSLINEVWSYEDNDSIAAIYGLLYTWEGAMNYSSMEKAQGICPDGWHIPSDEEWTQLGSYLGGDNIAGGKMKESGTTHWSAPNTGGTNESGFTSLPAGEYDDSHYQFLGLYNVIWSSTEANSAFAKYRYISYEDEGLHSYTYYKNFRYSVRCIKNETVGLNNQTRVNLRVFPNPVDMVLNIQKGSAEPTETVVYDQCGKEVKRFTITGEKHCENFECLEPGIYFIKVKNGPSCTNMKFIKK